MPKLKVMNQVVSKKLIFVTENRKEIPSFAFFHIVPVDAMES